MKTTLPKLIVVLALIYPSLGEAQTQTRFLGFDKGQRGVGLLLGKPTGGRYVYWLNWRRSLMGDLVYDFDGILSAQGSYALYFYDAKDQWKRRQRGFNSFLFYAAPGVIIGARVAGTDTASSFVLGLRGAGGLEYIFGRGAWAVRAELAGTLNILGRTLAGVQGMVGITHYFGAEKTTTKKGSGTAEDDNLYFEGQDYKKRKSNPVEDEFSEFE